MYMAAILQINVMPYLDVFKYCHTVSEHGVGIKCLNIEISAGKRNFYVFMDLTKKL
jgi:hypothetical protein